MSVVLKSFMLIFIGYDFLNSVHAGYFATIWYIFCYQAKKWIGSFTAVLGGLDTLVFSGGIGEHSPQVRSKVCDGLQFLGIELDEARNEKNEGIISTDKSKVYVRVIQTNEELMIAKLVSKVLKNL